MLDAKIRCLYEDDRQEKSQNLLQNYFQLKLKDRLYILAAG